jgi:hypothetical protein
MTFKAGKAEIQIDILGQWYAQDEQLALIAAHQLVGYTFGNIFSPSGNLIIELTGDPGDGKSVRLIAQSSMKVYRSKVIISFILTLQRLLQVWSVYSRF